MANVAPAGQTSRITSVVITEVIDDVRDGIDKLRDAEENLLDVSWQLVLAKQSLRDAEIELLLGPAPIDPDTTRALTVPQREAYNEQQTTALRQAVDDAERKLRGRQADLRLAQEECRTNRVVLSALSRLDDDE